MSPKREYFYEFYYVVIRSQGGYLCVYVWVHQREGGEGRSVRVDGKWVSAFGHL